MFAKVFSQIFDSSIAEKYQTRHVFMDLLVLADSEGVVDMTMEAIGRRTNVPLSIVGAAIAELMQPDPRSRSKSNEGRRLEALDGGRDWGWRIVNYGHYRRLLDEDARRSYFRDYRRRERERQRAQDEPVEPNVQSVQLGSPKFTQGEGEGYSTTTTPPSLDEANGYAIGASVIIPPDCVQAWHDDRTRDGWTTIKGGVERPVREWRADLRAYARHWKNNDNERKARNEKRVGNHRTDAANKPGRYAAR